MTPPTVARRLCTLGAIAATLSACATGPSGPVATGPLPPNPLEHYPLRAVQAPEEVALAVHAQGLSDHQRAVLTDFVGRWRGAGETPISVRAPADAPDAAAAGFTARETLRMLARLGVPPEALRLTSYGAGGRPGAPVIATFSGYVADIPDCSTTWTNLTSTNSNELPASFGCAERANMAAMVANPRDLIAPHPEDPADAGRRDTVMGLYRQGKITSSAKDDQAKGTVSSAVSN